MITVMLYLLRLLPFVFGGHRQLAFENLALRQQLAVYQRTATRLKLRTMDRLLGGTGQGWGWVDAASPDCDPGHRPAVAAASLSRVPGQAPAGRPAVAHPSLPRSTPWSAEWPPRIRSGAPRESMASELLKLSIDVRAHRIPADAEAGPAAIADLADVPRQP
jgi:hypothetical protein